MIYITTMIKEITIPISTGIGDIILISAALNKIKHKYDRIHIKPRFWYAEESKRYTKEQSERAREFCNNLLKLLLKADEKFIITETKKNDSFEHFEKLCKSVIEPVLPRFEEELCLKDCNEIEGEYIVVTTKIRGLKTFSNKWKEYFKVLNELSEKYKIVVVGEKDYDLNTSIYEKVHYFHCYYNELMKNIKNNIIDLTVDGGSIFIPDLEQIKKDCTIMNRAKYVITVGFGGNFILGISVANRMVNWREHWPVYDCIMNQKEEFYSYFNYESFEKKLGKI